MQLEKLTPDLTSLCNLVSSLPVPSAKHRLVRTEIAQKAAYILKNVIGLQVKLLIEVEKMPGHFSLNLFDLSLVGQRIRGNCGPPSFCPAATPPASCDAGLLALRA
jgi:hypothetical protein